MRTRSTVKKLLANKRYNLEDDGLSDVSTISVLSEPSKTDYNSTSNRNKLCGKKVENILKNVDNNNKKKCNNPKNKIAKIKQTTRIRVPRMSQFFRQLDNYKMLIYIILFVFIITMGTFFDDNWIKQNNIKLFNIEHLYNEIQTLKLKLKRIYSNTNTDNKHQCCEINRKYIIGLNKKLSWISSYIGFTPNGKNIKDFYDYWIYENMNNNLTNQIFNLQSDLNQLNNAIRIEIQHINNQIMEYTKLNIQKPKYQLDQRVLENITYINNKLSEIKNENIIIDKDINNIYNELQILDQTQQVLREMIWSMIQRNENKIFHNSEISTYKNSSNKNLTNFQNIEVIIQKMIQQRLDLDDTSMVDWAQVSLGSNVIEPKKNKTCLDQFNNYYYVPNIINILKWSIDKIKYHIFHKYSDRNNEILYNNHKYCVNPNTIITSNHKSIGECLTIKTGSQIIIKLSVPINITMIGIDHILYPLDYDHGQTVPRNISVYCINDIIKERNYKKQNYIGSFIYKYPQPNQKLQLFNVKKFLVCNKAKFIIHSSYGTNKVCIYRLRIFGYPVFSSYLNNNIQIIDQYMYKYIKIIVYHLYKWLIYLPNKLFEINNNKQNNSSNNYYINKSIENYNISKRNSYKNPTLYNNIKIYENANQTIKKNRQRTFL
ncbi:hypothetical protein cand_008180 [Cryptosporidium andersoni]|uniref:SUN domain-containing protein n=1 Tax=Cryptosporidium andersoni TaxID=117008 RepID=A0A1J4MPG7_9CRYT|nr:hypothetical protein cand_008180 [Cryptosporidium andersoni]